MITMTDGSKVYIDGDFNDIETLSTIISDVVNKSDYSHTMNSNVDQTTGHVKSFEKAVSFPNIEMPSSDKTLDGPVAATVIKDGSDKDNMMIVHKLSFKKLESDSFDVSVDAKLSSLGSSLDMPLPIPRFTSLR